MLKYLTIIYFLFLFLHSQVFAWLPNDTETSSMWGFENAQVYDAWDISDGVKSDNNKVIVAVIDSSMDNIHPDLADNIWKSNNCVDWNGNSIAGGCSLGGYDIADNDDDTSSGDLWWKPTLNNAVHGTHVMGTVGAATNNNLGVPGVANALIMPLKIVLSTDNEMDVNAIVNAIRFAVNNGASSINLSLGGRGYDYLLEAAVDNAANSGVSVIMAAGNYGEDNDSVDFTPANASSPNTIVVANIQSDNSLNPSSNYGLVNVDIGAPGTNILSTVFAPSVPGNSYWDLRRYMALDGTSQASPFIAGVSALVIGANNNLTAPDIKKIILDSGIPTEALAGKTVSGKRVNALNAVKLAYLPRISNLAIVDPATDQVASSPVGLPAIKIKFQASTTQASGFTIQNSLNIKVFKDSQEIKSQNLDYDSSQLNYFILASTSNSGSYRVEIRAKSQYELENNLSLGPVLSQTFSASSGGQGQGGQPATTTRDCLLKNAAKATRAFSSGSWGSCVASACLNGFHFEDNACVPNKMPCSPSGNFVASGSQIWNGSSYGACAISSCQNGYHLEGQSCIENSKGCLTKTGEAGVQSWNILKGRYNSCVANILKCKKSYHAEGSICVSNAKSCIPVNGKKGSMSWVNNIWSDCMATVCHSGYNLSSSTCVSMCSSGQHSENGSCINDSKSCSSRNSLAGVGTSTWNYSLRKWGPCIVSDCKSKYKLERGVCVPR